MSGKRPLYCGEPEAPEQEQVQTLWEVAEGTKAVPELSGTALSCHRHLTCKAFCQSGRIFRPDGAGWI